MIDIALADKTLPVAEIFGPTFQGEGPSTGQLAAFVRLGGCNLTCRACDTPYTWDASRYDLRTELTPMTAAQIVSAVPAGPRLVVVTGGEPLLYRHRATMADFVTTLIGQGRRIEIETNGTLHPAAWMRHPSVHFNVSPKLDGPMSYDAADKRIQLAALQVFANYGQAIMKVVVDGPDSVDQAVGLADQVGFPRERVWVMPEGTTVARTLATAQGIADRALLAGVNLTLRQHVLLWPNTERGR